MILILQKKKKKTQMKINYLYPFLVLFQAYANVLKANMDNLKKRDKRTEKSKAKKSKATQ